MNSAGKNLAIEMDVGGKVVNDVFFNWLLPGAPGVCNVSSGSLTSNLVVKAGPRG